MPSMDRWSPKPTGVRDPRDKSKKNGMFFNWPRFLRFGGAATGTISLRQDGTMDPKLKGAEQMVGPISDRGKGGHRLPM